MPFPKAKHPVHKRNCGTCNGKKVIMKPLWKTGEDGKPMYETVICPDCNGTGEEK